MSATYDEDAEINEDFPPADYLVATSQGMTIRVSPEEYEALRQVADAARTTVHSVVDEFMRSKVTLEEREWHVAYEMDVSARTPREAAEYVAHILADGGAQRGSYSVRPHSTGGPGREFAEVVIDLGENEF